MIGARAAIFDREQDREINVQHDRAEQDKADDPKQRPEIAQMLGVAVDPFRPEKDLQIAEQMTDHKQDQDGAGRGDDHFSSDGGVAKSRERVHLLPGFTAGMRARSAGNLSGSKFSTFISTRLKTGQAEARL